MRYPLVLLLMVLASAAPLHAQSSDPAYVDSPQSKSVLDPARTDGVTGSAPQTQAQAQYDEDAAAAQATADSVAQVEKAIAAQTKALQDAQAQAMSAGQQQMGYQDPPIGGRNMLSAMGLDRGVEMAPSYPAQGMGSPPPGMGYPGPGMRNSTAPSSMGRQIGSGLLQDAAGVVDTRIQQQVYGRNGPVLMPGGY